MHTDQRPVFGDIRRVLDIIDAAHSFSEFGDERDRMIKSINEAQEGIEDAKERSGRYIEDISDLLHRINGARQFLDEGAVDNAFYYGRNANIAAASVNPKTHFDQLGWREGRDPNPIFDTSYYLATNPDVAAAGINPLDHYNAVGWREGRDPSTLFSTREYLRTNPDVGTAGANPMEHYLEHGFAEGRATVVSKLLVNELFYSEQNPDVAAAGVDPSLHYDQLGWREGRDPNPLFDTSHYLENNLDVAAAMVPGQRRSDAHRFGHCQRGASRSA